MKSVLFLLLTWVLLQWNFLATEGLKCYKCVNHVGNIYEARRPPDKSCEVDGKPFADFLNSCKNSTQRAHEKETCGLIYIEGNDKGVNYKITVRDCLLVNQQKPLGCNNMAFSELIRLLHSIGHQDLERIVPSDASIIKMCTCDKNGCNKNAKSTETNTDGSSSYSTTLSFGCSWIWITFLAVIAR